MKTTDYTKFIKEFFEKYYEKFLEISEIAVTLPGVPKDMWVEGCDPDEEWKQWKLIPSNMHGILHL